MYISVFRGLRNLLDYPAKVFILCFCFFMFSMLTTGLWWRLWALNRDVVRRVSNIEMTQQHLKKLDQQLHQAQDLKYIEKQAKDRLDLAAEDDLVFVFPEE